MSEYKKDIYDMLNDVEIDLDEYKKEDFTDIEKIKLKKEFRKNIKNNKNYKKYIAVASVALISIVVVSQTKLGVYAYETLNDIAYGIKTALGIESNLEKYTENINQSVTKRKLTVKINEVILDGNKLLVSVSKTYSGELKEGEHIEFESETLYVNGKRINEGSGGSYKKINKNTEQMVMEYELGKDDYKGDINIKLRMVNANIINKNSENHKKILGTWTFKFKVNGDELRKSTKEIKLNKEIELDNGYSVKIENYRENIINESMDVKINRKVKNGSEDTIILIGRDNLGNKVKFIPDQGMIGTDDTYSRYTYKFDNTNNQFDHDAKELKLTPYVEFSVEKDGKYITQYNKVGEMFTIDLKKE